MSASMFAISASYGVLLPLVPASMGEIMSGSDAVDRSRHVGISGGGWGQETPRELDDIPGLRHAFKLKQEPTSIPDQTGGLGTVMGGLRARRSMMTGGTACWKRELEVEYRKQDVSRRNGVS